jgi:hypothetical protein
MRAGLVLVLFAACAPARAPERATHYVGPGDRPLPQLEAAWEIVHEFFGDATPDVVHVAYVERGTSRFDPEKAALMLSRESLKSQSEIGVTAHETAHLALARLTKGASTTEPLRFLDEGLASILQSRADRDADAYKARAAVVAAQRAHEDDAILEHARHWSVYFGDPATRADYEAYDVGASFVLFLFAGFGEYKTRRLLADLGETRDLALSCLRVTSTELSAIELSWRAALDDVVVQVPRVVAQSPSNEDEAVPVETTELVATFDVPMQARVCLNAPCHEGICFDHATWRTPTELVVRLTKPLRPSRWYEVTLGTPTCRLASRAGAKMPPKVWHFKTRT